MDEYRSYQNEREINITPSGPSLAEDSETMIGSMFLNEAPADAGSSHSSTATRVKNDARDDMILTRFLRSNG